MQWSFLIYFAVAPPVGSAAAPNDSPRKSEESVNTALSNESKRSWTVDMPMSEATVNFTSSSHDDFEINMLSARWKQKRLVKKDYDCATIVKHNSNVAVNRFMRRLCAIDNGRCIISIRRLDIGWVIGVQSMIFQFDPTKLAFVNSQDYIFFGEISGNDSLSHGRGKTPRPVRLCRLLQQRLLAG